MDCRVPVRSRHKLLGDSVPVYLHFWGHSRSLAHVGEVVCNLGLMPLTTFVALLLPHLPPASPVICASHSQEKPILQKHTSSKGARTALTQSEIDLAQAEKEVGLSQVKSGLGNETVGLAILILLARMGGEINMAHLEGAGWHPFRAGLGAP